MHSLWFYYHTYLLNLHTCTYAISANETKVKHYQSKHLNLALLFLRDFMKNIYWTHLPSPLSTSIPLLLTMAMTFNLYQSPTHFISCCYSLLLETSCLCRAQFPVPLTVHIRQPSATAWPALWWMGANALKQWENRTCGWAITHSAKSPVQTCWKKVYIL